MVLGVPWRRRFDGTGPPCRQLAQVGRIDIRVVLLQEEEIPVGFEEEFLIAMLRSGQVLLQHPLEFLRLFDCRLLIQYRLTPDFPRSILKSHPKNALSGPPVGKMGQDPILQLDADLRDILAEIVVVQVLHPRPQPGWGFLGDTQDLSGVC